MVSKSFCLEDLQVDTKRLPITIDEQPMTPQLYKTFQNKQGKDFLQLYIRARSQGNGSKKKQRPRSQRGYDSDRGDINNENDYNVAASEPHSPNVQGHQLSKKTILRNVDTNHFAKDFAPDKPSRFKLNYQVEKNTLDQCEEAKDFSFKPEQHFNNESLHYIESKETIEANQGPTSMEILLPVRRETQSRDLETQNNNEQESIREQEQEEDQQQQENANEPQTNNDFQAIEIETNNGAASDVVVFSQNVESAYKNSFKTYALTLLSYAALLGLSFGILPAYAVILFAMVIQGYFIYQNCKTVPPSRQNAAEERKKMGYNFQLLSLEVLELLAILQLQGHIDFPLTVGMVFNIIALLLTCYFKKGTRNSSVIPTLLQTLLSLQLLTICLRVDGFIEWSWTGIFFVSWAFLTVIAIYCVGLFMMFMFYLCLEEANVTRSYQLVGLLWVLVGFCGYTATAFTLVYGFTSVLDTGNNQKLIQFALIGGLAHVAFLSVLTLLAKNKVKRFLQRLVRPDAQDEETRAPEVKFKKDNEGLPPYIIRFTPSYFLTFDESLKVKDGKKLKNMKKKLTLTKAYQYRRSGSQAPMLNIKLTNQKTNKLDNAPLFTNLLPSDLNDQPQVSDTPIHSKVEKAQSPTLEKLKQMLNFKTHFSEGRSPIGLKTKSKIFASEVKRKNQKAEELNTSVEIDNDKLCFSAGDLEFVKKMEVFDILSETKSPTAYPSKRAPSEKDEEKACIICFDKFPDAVVMGCGHGGICYECAIESWKKSQECFMCRGKIEKVLHIDTNKMGKLNMNIRRVLSATKIVKEEPHYDGLRPMQYGESYTGGLNIAINHL